MPKLDINDRGLPNGFVIGPHRWRFVYDEEAVRDLREQEMRGCTFLEQHKIIVDPDRPHTAVCETIVHELLHVTWHTSGLYETPRIESAQDEEVSVTRMAPLLLHVLRANPAIVAFLQADPEEG